MSDGVLLTCARPVTLPRKVANAYAEAVRQGKTGNFTIHLRGGQPLGVSFEVKESCNDEDRQDTVTIA